MGKHEDAQSSPTDTAPDAGGTEGAGNPVRADQLGGPSMRTNLVSVQWDPIIPKTSMLAWVTLETALTERFGRCDVGGIICGVVNPQPGAARVRIVVYGEHSPENVKYLVAPGAPVCFL